MFLSPLFTLFTFTQPTSERLYCQLLHLPSTPSLLTLILTFSPNLRPSTPSPSAFPFVFDFLTALSLVCLSHYSALADLTMSEETYPNCDYGPPGSGRPGGRDPPRASRDLPSESAANPSGPAVNEASNMTGQTTAPVGGGIYVIHPGVLPIPVRRASGGPSLVTGQ